MSVRITDLPEATELNGSELMPIVQNGVTRRTTLDFVNQAAPAALILQQTQQLRDDTVAIKVEVEGDLADWETRYLGSHFSPPPRITSVTPCKSERCIGTSPYPQCLRGTVGRGRPFLPRSLASTGGSGRSHLRAPMWGWVTSPTMPNSRSPAISPISTMPPRRGRTLG